MAPKILQKKILNIIIQGNVNFMNAREGVMENEEYGHELNNLYPIVEKNLSDSGSLDNVVEFLVQCSDRSLPEAMVRLFTTTIIIIIITKYFYNFCFRLQV